MTNSAFFLSDPTIHALGWTLMHSLWQGAAAALAFWLIRPRLRSARQRYWVAYGALSTVLAAALVTFGMMFDAATAATGTTQELAVLPGADAPGVLTVAPPVAPDIWKTVAGWLEAYHPVIVTVWLLGLVFFLIQLAGGLHYVYRLRRRANQPAQAVWQEKLETLADRLHQTRPVQLLESALVQTPVALGYFKPLILLPLGLVNQLGPQEVEAVLAHELAHIARRDWLFNLFQALIDALFYFHPAVWWISANVRAERENCCDDTAVSLTGNRLLYAKTLVRLQDWSARAANPSALVLGLEGTPTLLRRRPLLLDRIKRILHQPQQSASLMEKMIVTALLLALITFWTLRANTPPRLLEAVQAIAEKPVAWLAGESPVKAGFQAPADSLPKPKHRQTIVQEDEDQRVEMDVQDGQITRLKVGDKEIPKEEYAKYDDLTSGILRESAPPPPPPGVPAPPDAPGSLFPPTAPAPPTPPRGWDGLAPMEPMEPMAPMAPMPPFGPASRVRTDKDAEGNTVIRVEQDGKPVEITVKGKDVWIDGKKIEDGQTIDIPGDNQHLFYQGDDGRSFRIDGRQFHFNNPDLRELPMPGSDFKFDSDALKLDGELFYRDGPDAQVWQVPDLAPSAEDLENMNEDALRNFKEQQRALQQELKAQEKAWKKNKKEWSKERSAALLEQEKALGEARRSMEVSQMAQREALVKARKAQLLALEEARAAQQGQAYVLRQHNESVNGAIKNSLIRDKLISDPNSFSFELSGKTLTVDGKKQPDEMHRKYLDLYRRKTGKELSKKDSIRIEEEN